LPLSGVLTLAPVWRSDAVSVLPLSVWRLAPGGLPLSVWRLAPGGLPLSFLSLSDHVSCLASLCPCFPPLPLYSSLYIPYCPCLSGGWPLAVCPCLSGGLPLRQIEIDRDIRMQ